MPQKILLNISHGYQWQKTMLFAKFKLLNPISHELWIDVITQAGAIMAQIDFSHPEAACKSHKAQK